MATGGYYVQVRYPHGERWETVAVSAHRGVAATLAGGMYRDLRDDAGRSPLRSFSSLAIRTCTGDWPLSFLSSRYMPPASLAATPRVADTATVSHHREWG